MHKLEQPCKECPFRKVAPAGWLGPWTAADLMDTIPHHEVPCHKTIKGRDTVTPDMEVCAGAALFLNNKLQLSRAPLMAAHQQHLKERGADASGVFANRAEFMAHHTKGKSG